ncbi:MAG: peptidoglycan binding domain-containing protein [Anaerolineae bacterium]|nr:peptidoglycan binding domain-containing protein [Anaerolineae bacterium]
MSESTQPSPSQQETRAGWMDRLEPPPDPTRVHAPVPVEAPPPARRRHRRRGGGLNVLIAGTGIGLVVLAALGMLLLVGGYAAVQVSNVVLPGVSAGDVALGGMSRAEAAAVVDATWNGERGLIVTAGEETYYAALAEFGLTVSADATAQRALEVGRSGGLPARAAQIVEALGVGYAVRPVVTLDGEAARAGLQSWAERINQPPRNATLSLESGQITALPGEPGYSLDAEATLAALAADPAFVLLDGYLPLALVPVAPQVVDASAAVEAARALLSGPLAITVYDPIVDERIEQNADPATIAGWLSVQTGEAEPQVVVDPGLLAGYLQGISAGLGEGRGIDVEASAAAIRDALAGDRVAVLPVVYSATTYTVQPGQTLTAIAWEAGMPYWRIIDANPGIDPDALTPGSDLVIPPKSDLLPLPVIPGKRLVVDISEQRLYVYENGGLINTFIISTGIDRSPTQPGVFQVQTHDISAYASVWDLTMPHFLGIYEAWPGFMNGFHGLPTLSSGAILWADVLGRPASYGCIILNLDEAEWLYTWAEDGTVTVIQE